MLNFIFVGLTRCLDLLEDNMLLYSFHSGYSLEFPYNGIFEYSTYICSTTPELHFQSTLPINSPLSHPKGAFLYKLNLSPSYKKEFRALYLRSDYIQNFTDNFEIFCSVMSLSEKTDFLQISPTISLNDRIFVDGQVLLGSTSKSIGEMVDWYLKTNLLPRLKSEGALLCNSILLEANTESSRDVLTKITSKEYFLNILKDEQGNFDFFSELRDVLSDHPNEVTDKFNLFIQVFVENLIEQNSFEQWETLFNLHGIFGIEEYKKYFVWMIIQDIYNILSLAKDPNSKFILYSFIENNGCIAGKEIAVIDIADNRITENQFKNLRICSTDQQNIPIYFKNKLFNKISIFIEKAKLKKGDNEIRLIFEDDNNILETKFIKIDN